MLLRLLALIVIVSSATSLVRAAPLPYFKSCYILFTVLDDLGYTHTHNLGRLAAHQTLLAKYPNTKMESIYVQNGLFSNTTQLGIDFVQQGCHIVHFTATTWPQTAYLLASMYPNVTVTQQNAFSNLTGPANLINYASRTWYAWYAAGRISAKTASNICVMAAWNNISDVVAATAGFAQGVYDENPSAFVRPEMLPMQSWWDPTRETLAAKALHTQLGCKIIAQYTDTFQTAQYASTLPRGELFAVQMHGQANTYFGDVVLTCMYQVWASVYTQMDEYALLGLPPLSNYIFSADVPHVCDVSPLASGATSLFASNLDVSAVQPFPGLTDFQIRNLTTPPANLLRVHPPMLQYSDCAAGKILTIQLDAASNFLVGVCVACPANSYTTDHTACLACPSGLVSAAGSSACSVPASSLNVGSIVGGVVGAAAGLILIFVAITVIHRQRVAGMLRDNTNAPKVSPAGIIFTDIQGSTRLWNEDPDGMAEALTKHNDIMRAAIAKHHAYEVKTVGDCFMIATPDAKSALAIAIDVQTEMTKCAWPKSLPNEIKVRIGIDFGPLDVNYDETTKGYDYFGPTVNRAARCEQAGAGGHTLLPVAVASQCDLSTLQPAGIRLSEPFMMAFHGFEEETQVAHIIIPGVTNEMTWAQKRGADESSDHSSGSTVDRAASYVDESGQADVQQHSLVQRGYLTDKRYVLLRALAVEMLNVFTAKMRSAEKRDFMKDLAGRFGLRVLPPGSEGKALINRVLQSTNPAHLINLASLLTEKDKATAWNDDAQSTSTPPSAQLRGVAPTKV